MNYRRIVLCAVLLLGPCAMALSGTTGAERWYDVRDIQVSVYAEKKVIPLSPEEALKLFTGDFPRLRAGWREELAESIDPDPAAHSLPDLKGKSMFREEPEAERAPYAEVVRFSETDLEVMVLKPKGQYLWHRYYECLADFQVPRSAKVDALFDVGRLVSLYASRYKGIGYGDSAPAVVKALGEPDAVEDYQPLGYYRYSYFKDDIVIQFQDDAVKTIRRGVPAELKREVKQKGKRITRA